MDERWLRLVHEYKMHPHPPFFFSRFLVSLCCFGTFSRFLAVPMSQGRDDLNARRLSSWVANAPRAPTGDLSENRSSRENSSYSQQTPDPNAPNSAIAGVLYSPYQPLDHIHRHYHCRCTNCTGEPYNLPPRQPFVDRHSLRGSIQTRSSSSYTPPLVPVPRANPQPPTNYNPPRPGSHTTYGQQTRRTHWHSSEVSSTFSVQQIPGSRIGGRRMIAHPTSHSPTHPRAAAAPLSVFPAFDNAQQPTTSVSFSAIQIRGQNPNYFPNRGFGHDRGAGTGWQPTPNASSDRYFANRALPSLTPPHDPSVYGGGPLEPPGAFSNFSDPQPRPPPASSEASFDLFSLRGAPGSTIEGMASWGQPYRVSVDDLLDVVFLPEDELALINGVKAFGLHFHQIRERHPRLRKKSPRVLRGFLKKHYPKLYTETKRVETLQTQFATTMRRNVEATAREKEENRPTSPIASSTSAPGPSNFGASSSQFTIDGDRRIGEMVDRGDRYSEYETSGGETSEDKEFESDEKEDVV